MKARWPWVLLLVALLALGPQFLKSYQVYLLSLAAVYALAALGLNLLTGYAGQISLGHAGFLAIGGYSAALLQGKLAWPLWASLPAAGLLTALLGLVLVIPALRLSEIYLAIATLGFGVAVEQLLPQWAWTGGHQGFSIPRPELFGLALNSDLAFYYLILAVGLALVWIAANAVRAPLGRAFVAIRDNELAAQALGISLARTKSYAFLLSAFYTGIAGALYANLVGYLNVSTFNLGLSILLLSMIAVGGLASIPGSLLGAAFLGLLPQVLSGFSAWVPQFIYGAALLLVVIFMPYGIWGFLLQTVGRGRGLMRSARRLFPGPRADSGSAGGDDHA